MTSWLFVLYIEAFVIVSVFKRECPLSEVPLYNVTHDKLVVPVIRVVNLLKVAD